MGRRTMAGIATPASQGGRRRQDPRFPGMCEGGGGVETAPDHYKIFDFSAAA